MGRLAAIEGGGDWADASVVYLVLADETPPLEELRRKYDPRSTGNYQAFPDWLIENWQAKPAGPEEIEVFCDD